MYKHYNAWAGAEAYEKDLFSINAFSVPVVEQEGSTLNSTKKSYCWSYSEKQKGWLGKSA